MKIHAIKSHIARTARKTAVARRLSMRFVPGNAAGMIYALENNKQKD
jgi:hypothetical protein